MEAEERRHRSYRIHGVAGVGHTEDGADSTFNTGRTSGGASFATNSSKGCQEEVVAASAGSLRVRVSPPSTVGVPKVGAATWPDGFAALVRYAHAKGLKVGAYTDTGAVGCCQPREVGSLGFEALDVATFAEWGVDHVAVDNWSPERDGAVRL